MLDKKELEYQILLLFRELMIDFPSGKIEQNESPDFLIWINHRKNLGIELTELRGQEFYDQHGHYTNPENIKEHIEDTISAKEEKIYLYQKNKSVQLWLLIHIESFQNKLRFNFQNKIESWNFSSAFDHVFLLEIKTQRLCKIS